MKRTILESGSAIHVFGYTEENLAVAADLGHYLTNTTLSLDELAGKLMSLPAKEIADASISMSNKQRAVSKTKYWIIMHKLDKTHLMKNTTIFIFVQLKPTQLLLTASPERRTPVVGGEKTLITQSPELYVIDPDVVPKPMFIGMNNRECLTFFYSLGRLTKARHRFKWENL